MTTKVKASTDSRKVTEARFLTFVKATWRSRFGWVLQRNVIRPALVRSRLGIHWKPEWDSLEVEELQSALAAVLAATHWKLDFPPVSDSQIWGAITAATKDRKWRSGWNSSSAGTFQVTVSYARNVWEYRTCDVSYNCRMELEIDPEDVREYIDAGDDSGLQRYIQSLVEGEQGEETSSEPSYGDEDTTGEEERGHDFDDHAGDGTSVYDIVERMMNREYPGLEEEEEEDDDEDDED
jgi:hypothetical protein